MLPPHRTPEVSVCPMSAMRERDAIFKYLGNSHRDAMHQVEEMRRMPSFEGGGRRGRERRRRIAPFHPLNYEISHGKFFSPCTGSSGTILGTILAGRGRRYVANNEDRWRGLWRPDTVPHLLIRRINQRFHPARCLIPSLSLSFSFFYRSSSRSWEREDGISSLHVQYAFDETDDERFERLLSPSSPSCLKLTSWSHVYTRAITS